jgi:hypothetical protein
MPTGFAGRSERAKPRASGFHPGNFNVLPSGAPTSHVLSDRRLKQLAVSPTGSMSPSCTSLRAQGALDLGGSFFVK